MRRLLLALTLAASLLGCTAGPMTSSGPAAAVDTPAAASSAGLTEDYTLGVADKVRILVFNEPTLSGEFAVGANGNLSVPLIGDVQAATRTTTAVRDEIQRRLADGYLRDPRVSVDVLTFRPYYILGEVNRPGEYPYATGLSILNAIATAQGYTYRADRRRVFVKRLGQSNEMESGVTGQVRPGDTIRVGERYF